MNVNSKNLLQQILSFFGLIAFFMLPYITYDGLQVDIISKRFCKI